MITIITLIIALISLSISLYLTMINEKISKAIFKKEFRGLKYEEVSMVDFFKDEIKQIKKELQHGKIENLNDRKSITDRITRLENPPKYKLGDKIKGGVIVDVKWHSSKDNWIFGSSYARWEYTAMDKKGNKFEVHSIADILEFQKP